MLAIEPNGKNWWRYYPVCKKCRAKIELSQKPIVHDKLATMASLQTCRSGDYAEAVGLKGFTSPLAVALADKWREDKQIKNAKRREARRRSA